MAIALVVGALFGPLLAYPVAIKGIIAGHLPGYIARGPYGASTGLVIIVVVAALLARYFPPRLRPRGPLGPFRPEGPVNAEHEEGTRGG